MDELIFEGVVIAGVGRHSELIVPGRSVLLEAPEDWPNVIFPGSLNVRVERYPPEFERHGFSNRVEELDRSVFKPTFEIARERLANNRLHPRPGVPRGGDAQVWRAQIRALDDSLTLTCWALRRFGSGVGEQLEFVAGQRLRALGLQENQRVQACLFGSWHDA